MVVQLVEDSASCRDVVKKFYSEILESSSRFYSIDCEWVHHDYNYKIALLSLYHDIKKADHAVLIRLCKFENYSDDLKDLLKDANILKVGFGVKQLQLSGLALNNVLDLSDLAIEKGYKEKGLSDLHLKLCGTHIPKYEQKSNWEASVLSQSQIAYAVLHVTTPYSVYKKLKVL